jgi:hypothetical protein
MGASAAPTFAPVNLSVESFWDVDVPANHLTWFANPTETNPPTGYRIHRRLEGESQDVLLATLEAVLSFVDSTPQPGARFLYTVVPFNNGGEGPAISFLVTTETGP